MAINAPVRYKTDSFSSNGEETLERGRGGTSVTRDKQGELKAQEEEEGEVEVQPSSTCHPGAGQRGQVG